MQTIELPDVTTAVIPKSPTATLNALVGRTLGDVSASMLVQAAYAAQECEDLEELVSLPLQEVYLDAEEE